MKATKAYIASLGTTGVLLGASILMLAVVSAVVAFDGWPNGRVSTRVQTLDISPNPEAGRLVTAAAIRPDGRLVAIRTYTEIYLFLPGVGGRLLRASERPCNIAGFDVGGEAIDFLDDSTFVLTSEATGRHAGTIQAVKCAL